MTLLYALALVSQIWVVSIYFPARLVGAVRQEMPELDEPQVDGYGFGRYLNLNRFAGILGLVPALVAWLSDFESSLTLILLSTGLYFFLQVAALVLNRDVRNLLTVDGGLPQRASRAFVIGAVAAYVAYVAVLFIVDRSEPVATQWAKIQVITLANLLFVLLIVTNLVRMRRASTEESEMRKHELGRSINVLATISIGLSVYLFGKEVLAGLDLQGLRPLMMSVFLQALILFTVNAQLATRPTQASDGRA
mgnify:CR=1 FL=1